MFRGVSFWYSHWKYISCRGLILCTWFISAGYEWKCQCQHSYNRIQLLLIAWGDNLLFVASSGRSRDGSDRLPLPPPVVPSHLLHLLRVQCVTATSTDLALRYPFSCSHSGPAPEIASAWFWVSYFRLSSMWFMLKIHLVMSSAKSSPFSRS